MTGSSMCIILSSTLYSPSGDVALIVDISSQFGLLLYRGILQYASLYKLMLESVSWLFLRVFGCTRELEIARRWIPNILVLSNNARSAHLLCDLSYSLKIYILNFFLVFFSQGVYGHILRDVTSRDLINKYIALYL